MNDGVPSKEDSPRGYQIAASFRIYRGQLNWPRFAVMLAVHSMLIGVISTVVVEVSFLISEPQISGGSPDINDAILIQAQRHYQVAKTSTLPAGSLIRERLVMEAKRLLAHTDNTAAEIYVELQFDDPSYFDRFSKRETGESQSYE